MQIAWFFHRSFFWWFQTWLWSFKMFVNDDCHFRANDIIRHFSKFWAFFCYLCRSLGLNISGLTYDNHLIFSRDLISWKARMFCRFHKIWKFFETQQSFEVASPERNYDFVGKKFLQKVNKINFGSHIRKI